MTNSDGDLNDKKNVAFKVYFQKFNNNETIEFKLNETKLKEMFHSLNEIQALRDNAHWTRLKFSLNNDYSMTQNHSFQSFVTSILHSRDSSKHFKYLNVSYLREMADPQIAQWFQTVDKV